VGEVLSTRSLRGGGCELRVSIPEGWTVDTAPGDSIAVQGVCLTVSRIDADSAVFQAVNETMRRTTLGHWRPGAKVNLERALRAGGRFGGHVVLGHVDAAALLRAERNTGTGKELVFELPAEIVPFIAEKGSVAVDGVSLTVAGAASDVFFVALIPETLDRTTLGSLRPGGRSNVEADVFARYVKRAVETLGEPNGRITPDFLKDHGFA